MRQKKQNQSGGIVYSTDPDLISKFSEEEEALTLEPGAQNLRIWLDRLKGGKVATVIRGYIGNTEDLEALGKRLKTVCGVGGSVKNHEVLLQGDVRAKVCKELDKSGYKYKLAGG